MYFGLNRYLCDVLEEMEACIKTNNFSTLQSLIEEARTMGKRMEAKLADEKDWRELKEQISEKKLELRTLRSELAATQDIKKLTK